MMKTTSRAIGLMALALTSAGAAGAQPVTVAWTLEPAGANGKSQKVQLSLSHRVPGSNTQISRTVPLADLPGLSEAQLASATAAQTRFRIPRPAGDLDCRGLVRQRRGSGGCAFVPNADFAREMSRLGIARPTAAQQFRLAMHDVQPAMVAELRRQGYAPLDLNKISSAAIHGVTADYLRGMDAAGYRAGSVDGLVQMRIHRIDPAYIRELALAGPGYRNLKVDELVSLRIHRIAAADVRAFAALGYRDLSPRQLTSLSIHRVTPAFVRDMATAGYRRLTPEQLVSLRIHGVDPRDARRANAALRRGQ